MGAAIAVTVAGDKAFASGTDINQFRAFKTPQDSLDYEARIDRILTAPPDLVVLDINMPGASGFQVCEAIRARSRVPIMMLTVRSEEVARLSPGTLAFPEYRGGRDREGRFAGLWLSSRGDLAAATFVALV